MTRKEKLTALIRRNRREMAVREVVDLSQMIESSVKKSAENRRLKRRLASSATEPQRPAERLASLNRRLQATRREMDAPDIDVAALIRRAVDKSREIPIDSEIASGRFARETAERLKYAFEASSHGAPRTIAAAFFQWLKSTIVLTRAGVALLYIGVGLLLGALVFHAAAEYVSRLALTAPEVIWFPIFAVMTVTGLVSMAAYFVRSLAIYAAPDQRWRFDGALPAVAVGLFFMFSAFGWQKTTVVAQTRTALPTNLSRHLAALTYNGFGAGPESLSVDTGRQKVSALPKKTPGGFVYTTKIKDLPGVTYEMYDLRFREEVTVVGRITSEQGTLALLSKALLELDENGQGSIDVLGASKEQRVQMHVACDSNVVAKMDTSSGVNAVTALLQFATPSDEAATVSIFRLTERHRSTDPPAPPVLLDKEVPRHAELPPPPPPQIEIKMSPFGTCTGTLAASRGSD